MFHTLLHQQYLISKLLTQSVSLLISNYFLILRFCYKYIDCVLNFFLFNVFYSGLWCCWLDVRNGIQAVEVLLQLFSKEFSFGD